VAITSTIVPRPIATQEAAAVLAPHIRDSVIEAERLHKMAPDLAARIEEAGLFAMRLPRTLGGLELDPPTIMWVVEEFSRTDGVSGWTTLSGMSSAFLAKLEPDVARVLIGECLFGVFTCIVAPTGAAAQDGDGWRVSSCRG
jgi:alkylation response protein AidB-like acyl-CoA dehydrogenase